MLKPKKNFKKPINSEFGQTLIETVIAIFILVSGIAAAVGLAIFALSNSQNLTRQMVAVGLAREGVEAVKNMRDTNWLKQATIDSDCYNPKSLLNDAKCYKFWQTRREFPTIGGWSPGEDLDPPASPTNFVLGMYYDDSIYADHWLLWRRPTLIVCNGFSLDFQTDPTNLFLFYGAGYYRPRCSGDGNSDFYRQIVLEEDDGIAMYGNDPTKNPFFQPEFRRLKVISRVWWTDKKCPRVASWPGLGKCSVELQTYLTNWKNY